MKKCVESSITPGACSLSLAAAAEVIEIIRDLYDEYLREHRLPKSGLPVEPGLAGVRDGRLSGLPRIVIPL